MQNRNSNLNVKCSLEKLNLSRKTLNVDLTKQFKGFENKSLKRPYKDRRTVGWIDR